MKITKLIHSCLLVEMPAPVNRTALFDPGIMSEPAIDVEALEFLDNVIITHNHPDHMHLPLIQKLVKKFLVVRVTATAEACAQLEAEGIEAVSEDTPGIELFESPHERIKPLLDRHPEQIGVHYLDLLTHPGDSHSFDITRQILALPVTAPWGSTVRAVNLALDLHPTYIIPVHDWHWSDEARTMTYDLLTELFDEQGIEFVKPETGVPFVLDVQTP